MAKLANRNALRSNPIAERNSRSNGRSQRADGFANLVIENPATGHQIPLSRIGVALNRSDEITSEMKALHNWMLDNPDEAKELTVKISSVVVLEEVNSEEIDFNAFIGKKSADSEPDETTKKLKELFPKS